MDRVCVGNAPFSTVYLPRWLGEVDGAQVTNRDAQKTHDGHLHSFFGPCDDEQHRGQRSSGASSSCLLFKCSWRELKMCFYLQTLESVIGLWLCTVQLLADYESLAAKASLYVQLVVAYTCQGQDVDHETGCNIPKAGLVLLLLLLLLTLITGSISCAFAESKYL